MAKDIHSGEIPVRHVADIIEDEDRAPDMIVSHEQDLVAKEYLDELAFANEELIVIIHKGREKYAPSFVPLGVNGDLRWWRVETELSMPRKYVEVLARAQQMDVQTRIDDEHGERPVNRIVRTNSNQYPYTIVLDRNPKGRAWITKIMRET